MADMSGSLVIFILTIVIAVCVYILNPITIVAIVTTPNLRRQHSNIFLINLAVVDLLMVSLVVSASTHFLMGHSSKCCIVNMVMIGTLATASLLSCFAIAVDRFLFIHKPLLYPVILTHARVIKTVVSMWAVSVLIGLIPLTDGELIEKPDCPMPITKAACIQGFLLLTLFFIAGFISVVLYTKLFFVIREHNKVLETHARAHCCTHDCRKQECRVTSRLGECRFLQDGGYNWTAKDCATDSGSFNSKYFLDRNRSCTSGQSGCNLPSSMSFYIDDVNSSAMLSQDDPSSRTLLCKSKSGSTINNGSQDRSPLAETAMTNTEQSDREVEDNTKKKKKEKKRVRFQKCQHLRDLRTIKTLMMMFAIYFICWAPLMMCRMVSQISDEQLDEKLQTSVWILAVSNSVWNFVVYPMRKRELRSAMMRMLKRCVRGCQRHHALPTSASDNTSSEIFRTTKKSTSESSRLD